MAESSARETLLVTGGGGYIGSHMVDLLLKRGYGVVVVDDLSTGHRAAVPETVPFIAGDIGDAKLLQDIFQSRRIDAVMHFAALSRVAESMENPSAYYHSNVHKTLVLLDAMRCHGVKKFIFSSTAAVFGAAEYLPIDSSHPKNPINPYGHSKLMVEHILADYGRAYGMASAVLRYFNACGADPEGRLGDMHEHATHLIPLAMQVANGRRDMLYIYGDDYDTEDGTCRRDYVHVCDLAEAHLLALEKINQEARSVSYNLGNGSGFTVRQVVDTARQVSGRDLPVQIAGRRPGDPAALVADARAAFSELGWKPKYASLGTIIEHAWQWEQRRVFNVN